MTLHYLHLKDELYEYILEQRSDAVDPILDALRKDTSAFRGLAQMAISAEQCSFLTMLVGMTNVKWAAEVGTFTGSSSISIARALAPGGKLFCFDNEFKWTSIARRHWVKAGLSDRIDLKIGDAAEMLQRFFPPAPLDLVFIDADKEGNDVYYEALLPRVRPGGLILFDNMLLEGDVIDPEKRRSGPAYATDQLNRKLAADPRIQAVMLPMADGLYLCRKR